MKVLVIGDCNTLGVGAFKEPAEFSYPMRLAELIRKSGEMGEHLHSDAVHLTTSVHQRLVDAMYVLWHKSKSKPA